MHISEGGTIRLNSPKVILNKDRATKKRVKYMFKSGNFHSLIELLSLIGFGVRMSANVNTGCLYSARRRSQTLLRRL